MLIFGLLTACKREKSTIQHSACKSFSGKSTNITSDSSCVYYTYNAAQQQLHLQHINAVFNCCPGELYADILREADTIFISEREEHAECDCMCLYDLELTVNGVAPGNYILKFIEPYATFESALVVALSLQQMQSDTFCVARANYPYGIN